jgi:hypothetical protein
MIRHRLAPEAEYYRLPEPPAPSMRPEGFMLCTIAVVPGCTAAQWAELHRIYVVALERAQREVRPSILERDLFAFRN